MNNNNEQNGRHQTREQSAPPTDPRIRSAPQPQPQPAPEPVRICRDFVWGICLMGQNCKYRHDLEFNSMRTMLRFCRDYQNRGRCVRPDCTYLHTSREEENLFLTTGQIPRVLAERYASMTTPLEHGAEPITQMMFNINEYITQPPPPPPLPGSGGSTAAPQPAPTPVPAPVPVTVQGSSMTGPMTATMPASVCNGSMPASITPMSGSMGPSMSGVVPPSISGSVPPLAAPMHPTISVLPLSGMLPAPRPMEQGSSPAPMQMMIPHGLPSPIPTPVPTAMPSILAPPPPPPPTTATTSAMRMTGAIYAAPQPMQQPMTAMYPMSPHVQLPQPQPQPSPLPLPYPIVFDPSRPPPLPVSAQNRKRSPTSEPEAPQPMQQPMTAMYPMSPHVQLPQPQPQPSPLPLPYPIVNELYRQEIESLQREEEYKRLLYEKKAEEYQNGRALLRSLISPEMFNDTFNSLPSTSSDVFPSTSSSSSSHSTVPRSLIIQLLECVMTNMSQSTAEHTPPPPPIETINRRATTEAEMFSTLFDMIRNFGITENRVHPVDTLNTNGLARLTNGSGDIASTSNAVSVRYPSTVMEALPVASTSRYSAPPPPAHHFPPETAAQPPAPAPFMAYPPAAPPPSNRPYYQFYSGIANSASIRITDLAPASIERPFTRMPSARPPIRSSGSIKRPTPVRYCFLDRDFSNRLYCTKNDLTIILYVTYIFIILILLITMVA